MTLETVNAIGSIGPILILLSIGLVVYGIFRLRGYVQLTKEHEAEEERLRKEFIARTKLKLK
ncbi:hypothetical protein C4564_04110 [Candidatus Microgenomates bacterium]|nr:MAG: hypothetical protein C4564_04110 [Candidatus Microgenomates bacterium]